MYIEQIKLKFQRVMKELGFIALKEDEYSLKYQNDKVYVQMFYGRYSEKPDIFIRFEDGDTPEQFIASTMLFVDDLGKGINSLEGIEGTERLVRVLNYFAYNHKYLLMKTSCRDSKIKLNKYIDANFT